MAKKWRIKPRVKYFALAICLSLALLAWEALVIPRLTTLTNTFSFSSDIISIHNFYDEDRHVFSGKQFTDAKMQYRVVEETDDYLKIENTFSVETIDNEPIFSTTREYYIDPITQKHVTSADPHERSGYLFAPKNLKKGESFTYWHANYDAPAVMEYTGTAIVNDLEVYTYETTYQGERVDQTEDLSQLPGVGETRGVILYPYLKLWVEPVTGQLINYHDKTIAVFYDLETGDVLYPWNQFENTFSENSVHANITFAGQQRNLYFITKRWIPLSAIILISLLFLLSFRSEDKVKQLITNNYFAALLTILPFCFSIFFLVLWNLNEEFVLLTSGSFGTTPNPLTLIGILLVTSSATLCFMRKKVLAKSIAGITIALFTIHLLDKLFQIGIHLDKLLFHESVVNTGSSTSIATTIMIILLAIAPAALSEDRKQRSILIDIVVLAVIALSLIGIIANTWVFSTLLDLTFFNGLSIQTSLLTLLTSGSMSLFLIRSYPGKGLRFGSLIILSFSVILTVSAAAFAENALRTEAELQFTQESHEIVDSIEERMAIYVNVLEGTRGFLLSSNVVERDEWKNYIEALKITENYPGIQGVGLSIFVTPEERDAHIAAIQAEGFPEYTINPPGERDIYSAIVFLEPFDERNQQAFGFDMFSESTRRNAMEIARDTGLPQLSGRITLVQEIDEDVQPGFLIYIPYYTTNTPPESLTEKRENIIGYTYAPFRSHNFFEGIFGKNKNDSLAIEVYDAGIANKEANDLYASEPTFVKEDGRFEHQTTIFFYGRAWEIKTISNPTYGETLYTKYAPIFIFIFGSLISILLTLVFQTITMSQKRAVDYANQVTQDLQSAKARDDAVLESIGDGLIVTDTSGRITMVNSAFTKLLGYTKKEALGKKLDQLIIMRDAAGKMIAKKDRPIVKATTSKEKQAIQVNSQVFYETKSGSYIPINLVIGKVIDAKGKVLGAVEVFSDITDAIQSDRAKTEFVSIASHQLRTPLTAIKWSAEALQEQEGKLTKQANKATQQILESTKRMNELVESLLHVSRLELGTLTVNKLPVDLKQILTATIEEQKYAARERRIKLDVKTPKNLPKIYADDHLVGIVFDNLISNAIKYSHRNATVEIRLMWSSKRNVIEFKVKDSGIGIPISEQDRVFTKMYRAENVKKMNVSGTGLGLYIAKLIVEEFGGNIYFTSKEGVGTTFYVDFPIKKMKRK